MKPTLPWTTVLALVMGCGASPELLDDAAAPRSATSKTYGSLLGRWSGVGYQSTGADWDMVVDIARTDEGPCAAVHYPDVDCTGYWTCKGQSEGDYLEAVERITSGRDKCIDQTRVRLRLTPSGRAEFEAQADDQTAEGTLERTY